jgi:hypothetical protein
MLHTSVCFQSEWKKELWYVRLQGKTERVTNSLDLAYHNERYDQVLLSVQMIDRYIILENCSHNSTSLPCSAFPQPQSLISATECWPFAWR